MIKHPKINVFKDGEYAYSSYAFRTCADAIARAKKVHFDWVKITARIDHAAPKEYGPTLEPLP